MANAMPNRGHRAIAHLMDLGKASVVVTQNVDNLHQVSGIPDEKVLELHGNAKFAKCLTCDERYELDDLERQYRDEGEVQPCAICGGIIKTGDDLVRSSVTSGRTHVRSLCKRAL